MKRLLNPTIALITFTVGVVIAAVWQMSRLQNSLTHDDSSMPSIVKPAPSGNSETEKYAVYSAVIKGMYLQDVLQLLVVRRGDDCQDGSDQNKVLDERVAQMHLEMEEWAIKQLPTLKQETIDDFHSQAKKCHSLTMKLDIPINYVLVDDKDLEPLFPKGEYDRWWRRFYTKYPYSSGIINFSNIGFNLEMDQALVYTGKICGGLCGAGHYVLVTKDQCGWKVQKKINTWVS